MSTRDLETALSTSYDYSKFETGELLKDIEVISEEKKLEAYFKDNLNSMLESVSNTRKIVRDKRSNVEELKDLLKEKTEETRKAVKNADKAAARKRDLLQKAESAHKDLNITQDAIENIENATRDLSQDEANIAKESLKPVLVKKTAMAEKADAELKAADQLEIDTRNKAKKLEDELVQLEETYNKKREEANNFASNITTTMNHIITSFGELIDVAKNLLESSVATDETSETTSSSPTDYDERVSVNESAIT